MKFKVGDWVRVNDKVQKIVEFIHEDSCGKTDMVELTDDYVHIDELIEWHPKEGEWCRFSNESMPKHIKVLAQFKELTDDNFAGKYSIIFNPEYVEKGVSSIHYEFCEPFIGEVPLFIKDKE